MADYCDTPDTLVLVLGADTFDLMDSDNGVVVSEVDLGYPTVRDVTAALPTRDGDFDTTTLFGPRAVSITGTVVPSPRFGSRQRVLDALARYTAAAARPQLRYAIDGDVGQRFLNLRPAQLSGPYVHPLVSAFSVGWVAPDPIAYSVDAQLRVVLAPGVNPGRIYPLIFPRTYPPGSGGAGTARLVNDGSYRTWPVFRIFGPCTDPSVTWLDPPGGYIGTVGLTVAAGDWVHINTATADVWYNSDPGASRYSNLDFDRLRWEPLRPGFTDIRFTAASAAPPCQAEVTWRHAYL